MRLVFFGRNSAFGAPAPLPPVTHHFGHTRPGRRRRRLGRLFQIGHAAMMAGFVERRRQDEASGRAVGGLFTLTCRRSSASTASRMKWARWSAGTRSRRSGGSSSGVSLRPCRRLVPALLRRDIPVSGWVQLAAASFSFTSGYRSWCAKNAPPPPMALLIQNGEIVTAR